MAAGAPGSVPAAGSAERLIRHTRWRLAAVTLALVAALVALVGATTAVVAIQALEANVDRALEATAQSAAAQTEGSIPAAGSGEGEDGGGETDHLPASADTFVLVLDSGGRVVSNPSRVALTQYPDPAPALEAVRANGRDMRTVSLDGVPVRLLTLPVPPGAEAGTSNPAGYVQAGFVMTLHDQQVASLVSAIVGAGLLGLIGAALVTALVTARALAPVRAAFARERRFVADASHELRTPVALVHASAEVLQREDLVLGEGRPLVDDILSESDRLGRLVGDLLTLAATDSHELATERQPLDLAEIVRDTVRRATPLAGERGNALVLGGTPDQPLPVLGDRDRLTQLLLILLDNAFGHSPPGGTVYVALARLGRDAEVSVCDQGPGVARDERERIFEPFARSAGTRARNRGGTGLGLAIAKEIAERHQGTIAVDDAPGGGARFVVAIPLA
jgi:signal transduction histidine kinase